MPYRIVHRSLPTCPPREIGEEQGIERVQDPRFEVKPEIITTPERPGSDDHSVSAMGFGADLGDMRYQSDWFYFVFDIAWGIERDVDRYGWDPIGAFMVEAVQPLLEMWPMPGSEMRRVGLGFHAYVMGNWKTSSAVGHNLTAYAQAMANESPRTMPTIQEWLDGVDRYGAATANLWVTEFPDESTPMWLVDDGVVPTIDMPPLARIAHELQRVAEFGSLSLSQESQRWGFIATRFPGTPVAAKAQAIAAWCSSQPLGADRTPYAAWVNRVLYDSFDALTPPP